MTSPPRHPLPHPHSSQWPAGPCLCVWTGRVAASGCSPGLSPWFPGLPQRPGSLLASAPPALSGVWSGGPALTDRQGGQGPHGTWGGKSCGHSYKTKGSFKTPLPMGARSAPCWTTAWGLEGDQTATDGDGPRQAAARPRDPPRGRKGGGSATASRLLQGVHRALANRPGALQPHRGRWRERVWPWHSDAVCA